MSKKSIVARQKRREKLVSDNWEKRQRLKKIIKNPNSNEEEFQKAFKSLGKMSPNTSSVRLRNRCALTGRPRGFLKKFNLSRLCFRELASRGMIPGVTKASW